MTADLTSWHRLPSEIRLMVLEVLLQDGCSLADFATVSREWQTIIERHNFSRIKLTSSRVADVGPMVYRNRSLVRYIWLCLELQEYDCTQCDHRDQELCGLSKAENTLVATAFQDLFSALSIWEPGGSLLLDITVYSPSDSKHWFKYLTFEPDIDSDIGDWDQHVGQSKLVKADDLQHGWIAGSRNSIPTPDALEKVFDEIMGEGPFNNQIQENQWWQQLPLLPAVTGVLLRQQTRRRWKPVALAHMFARMPGLREIHYEPWREWNFMQKFTDQSSQLLFESLTSNHLRRLVLFENFDQVYASGYKRWGCQPIRIPSSSVSGAVANASLTLEHLSASFIVDASQFFNARELSWKWPSLTWLALTSQLLVPQARPMELDTMLQAAAAAAMEMPNLETMEIWNGEKGLAMLIKYQRAERGRPAVITCRGTWELTLRPLVIQAWDSVAVRHGGQGHVLVKELLDSDICVRSHGDAIRYLRLSRPVIRPVSLRQIQMQHACQEGVQSQ